MTAHSDKRFTGSIPELYDTDLAPLGHELINRVADQSTGNGPASAQIQGRVAAARK